MALHFTISTLKELEESGSGSMGLQNLRGVREIVLETAGWLVQ